MLVRYRYRIDPTKGQRQALARAFGCARVVYNDALRERERAHAAGATFVRLLEDKAVQYGRTVIKVDRWAPTSQTCSACGVRDGPKPLNVRAWICRACGSTHDRDVNAARNILVAAGPVETPNACGAGVRPSAMAAVGDEAGTPRGVT